MSKTDDASVADSDYRDLESGSSSKSDALVPVAQRVNSSVMMVDIKRLENHLLSVPRELALAPTAPGFFEQLKRSLNTKNAVGLTSTAVTAVANVASYTLNPYVGLALTFLGIMTKYYSNQTIVSDRAAKLRELNMALNGDPAALKSLERPSQVALGIGILGTTFYLVASLYNPLATLIPNLAMWGVIGGATVLPDLAEKFTVRRLQNQIDLLAKVAGPQKYREALTQILGKLQENADTTLRNSESNREYAVQIINAYVDCSRNEVEFIDTRIQYLQEEIKEIKDKQQVVFSTETTLLAEVAQCETEAKLLEPQIAKYNVETLEAIETNSRLKSMLFHLPVAEDGIMDVKGAAIEQEIYRINHQIAGLAEREKSLSEQHAQFKQRISKMEEAIEKNAKHALELSQKLVVAEKSLSESLDEREIYSKGIELFAAQLSGLTEKLKLIAREEKEREHDQLEVVVVHSSATTSSSASVPGSHIVIDMPTSSSTSGSMGGKANLFPAVHAGGAASAGVASSVLPTNGNS